MNIVGRKLWQKYKTWLASMKQSKTVLITGASGLIGERLTEMLIARGFKVRHLGRTTHSAPGGVESFTWDIKAKTIDPRALDQVDVIIHLAGANVADKRWTDKRKKEIIESRTASAALIFDTLKKRSTSPSAFISASAIGYYGTHDGDRTFVETDKHGRDFLSDVTRRWEASADRFAELKMRVVKLRTGIVLSDRGGALEPIAKTVRAFIGSPLGTGKQVMSWIHIDDLCNIFMQAVESPMQGAYNCVSPQPVTNAEFVAEVAKVLDKPLIAPRVPEFVLKMMFGEMSTIVIDGQRVSSEKIQKAQYRFRFPVLREALRDLLQKH
jgi:uncharacterized protein (TIGR01777 family)